MNFGVAHCRYRGLVPALTLLCVGLGEAAFAQDSHSEQSGYENAPRFGGPSGVGETLEEDDREEGYRFGGIRNAAKPYFDWKDSVKAEYGLSFGLDYSALYHWSSESVGRSDEAAGGIFRFFGAWTLLDREGSNPGSIVYKVESRHRLGTRIAPQALGFEIGYAGLPAAQFGDSGWGLTNLHWKQKLNDGRFAFVVGIVDPTDYLNIYGLVDPLKTFSNLVFLTGDTIPAPSQGLGAAFGWYLSDQLYVVGGIADTNADPTDPIDNFDSFFDDQEYFTHVEMGWVSSFERPFFDNVHLTAWHADERDDARVRDGWGLALSATKFIDGRWMPFLRVGYAKDGGALSERSVSIGLGYYMPDSKDLLGIGLNWGRPSDTGVAPGLDDQYAIEVFYRLQLTPRFALTADVQLLIDPALNPDEDRIWVLGIRGRLAM